MKNRFSHEKILIGVVGYLTLQASIAFVEDRVVFASWERVLVRASLRLLVTTCTVVFIQALPMEWLQPIFWILMGLAVVALAGLISLAKCREVGCLAALWRLLGL